MATGVILDTSYLITLADANRANHQAAKSYWQYFAEKGLPLFLPTIVVSEFYIRQEIPPGILRSCVILPFNWNDALKAAELDFAKSRQDGVNRDALKDDVKIIAQAVVSDAAYVITDDTRTFYKYAKQLAEDRKASFKAIKLEDGFDQSFFNGGQTELSLEDQHSDLED